MNLFKYSIVLILASACAVLIPSTAAAWAPAGQATVHPGVQVFTEGA